MDRKLLDILCCPLTKQPLALLDTAELEALNAAIAATGVDCISVGALTKHVRAVDFSMRLGEPPAAGAAG